MGDARRRSGAARRAPAHPWVDLALNLIAARGLGIPQSYREAFTALARAGLIDPPRAADLARWAGLRNVLVPGYTSVDLDRMHAALSQTAPLRRFHAAASPALAG